MKTLQGGQHEQKCTLTILQEKVDTAADGGSGIAVVHDTSKCYLIN